MPTPTSAKASHTQIEVDHMREYLRQREHTAEEWAGGILEEMEEGEDVWTLLDSMSAMQVHLGPALGL